MSEAARRAKLGVGHFRRLVRCFEREGDSAVVHRARGRRPNNAKPQELRERVLERAREEVFHDFGPTLLSEHLARDPAIGRVNPHTLRRWLIDGGEWSVRRRGRRHRRWRPRKAAFGELVLMDTSVHAWLEQRSTEEIVLIAMIDDATSRLWGRFFPRDTGAANRTMIVSYLQRWGRMGALYTDCAAHFQSQFRASRRRAQDQPEVLPLIRRGLDALDIRLILALSPQAKGRVERLFGTLQDRLIKEMRVRGIASLEEANRFLEQEFIPFWNARFTVEPMSPVDAHRPLPEDVDLLRLFAETDERVIRQDFTFRFRNQHYQIQECEAEPTMPGTLVIIEHRLDGTTRYRWRESYLSPTPVAVPLAPACMSPTRTKGSQPRPLSGAAGKPLPPDHPWRRYPIRVGRGRYAPRSNVASAPAALRPSTSSVVEKVFATST